MNLPVVQFPERESVRLLRETDYGSFEEKGWLTITPYEFDPVQTIARFKIKVPFQKIITMDQGFSVCPHCNARYVGYQQNCTNRVNWYQTGSWHGWQRGDLYKGQRLRDGTVYATKVRECGEFTKWDLQDQFNAQKTFFQFVSLMSTLPEETSSIIVKNANALPPGSAEAYRIILMEQEIENLKMFCDRMRNFVEQMAQRMNQAGHALTF